MTKFVKWQLVDATTGIPVPPTRLNNSVHPNIEGLEFKFHHEYDWYGTCDDSAELIITIPEVKVLAGEVLTQAIHYPVGSVITPAIFTDGVETTPARLADVTNLVEPEIAVLAGEVLTPAIVVDEVEISPEVLATVDTVVVPAVLAEVDTLIKEEEVFVKVSPVESEAIFLTEEQLNSELAIAFNELKDNRFEHVWHLAKAKREQYTGKEYHPTEITAGLVKHTEALLALAAVDEAEAATVAPSLATEASIREIPIKDLATKVVERYAPFLQLEAVIAGYSGKLADQFRAMVYEPELLWDNFAKLQTVDVNAGWPV